MIIVSPLKGYLVVVSLSRLSSYNSFTEVVQRLVNSSLCRYVGGPSMWFCTLSTVHCPLFTVHCRLWTGDCTLFTVHCSLFTVDCRLYCWCEHEMQ